MRKLFKLYREFSTMSRDVSSRIVRGRDADRDEYPWQGMLLYDGRFRCGAVIVNERTLLTAAHCYAFYCHESNVKTFTVMVGTHTLRRTMPTTQIAEVAEFIVHPGYNDLDPFIGYDIGILHLKHPLTWTASVQPVRLSNNAFDEAAVNNSRCYVSGWGVKNERIRPVPKRTIPKILQETNTFILTNKVCNQILQLVGMPNRVGEDHVCTLSGDRSSPCSGDSGGPVGCYGNDGTFRVIGLVSFGARPCGFPNIPDVEIRVSYYRAWISENSLGEINF